MTRKTVTTTIFKANMFSVFISIPILIFYVAPFVFFHPIANLVAGVDLMLVWFILVFPVGVVLHEVLHGVTWALFVKTGFSAIRFGINWKVLTPYCHCKIPMLKWQYLVGTLMPFIVLGFLPAVCSWFSGNAFFLIIGVFFSWASGGDLLGVWMLRGVKRNQCVADHPYRLGFSIVECPDKK